MGIASTPSMPAKSESFSETSGSGAAGKPIVPGRLVALASALLFGSQAFLFFTMPAGRGFLPIAFLTLPLLAFCALLLFPAYGETVRRRLQLSIGLALAGCPFLLLSAPELLKAFPVLVGFCALAAACAFLLKSLSAAIRTRWPQRGAELPVSTALLAASIVPAWLGRGIAFSPFSALSDLLQIDWIRDGELYFRVPSGSPLEYPDWRWFALAAFLGGAIFSVLAFTWRRR